jgi:hypothetical protein
LTTISPPAHHERVSTFDATNNLVRKGEAMTPRLYIGTAGLSARSSDDLGETLQRFRGTSGLYSETQP